MKPRTVAAVLVGFFILLSAAFMAYYFYQHKNRPQTLPTIGNPGHVIDTFSFTAQDGRTVTRADVQGKVLVVEYFFTTCRGICPKMNDNMATVYAAFRGTDDVKILSHTVDPRKDTVGAMQAYAQRFEADPAQWMFLTGDKTALYDKARHSYLISAMENDSATSIDDQFIHEKHFVLVDRGGHLRGRFYDGTDAGQVRQLIGDVKTLLKEKG